MSIRKLATVQHVRNIQPIEGADRIMEATVKAWHVVVKKDEFQELSKCVFFEIDSILPQDKEWAEFLKPRRYRVKTCKLRGVLSQGLALPLSILPEQRDWQINDDVTELLGVTKYEPQIHSRIGGVQKGNFPEHTPKTDEQRLQSAPSLLDELKGDFYYITEKIDGSSGTYFKDEEGLHVCSRNWELVEDEKNAFWIVAKKYNLLHKLPVGISVQGEVHGPGIQKNRLGLKEVDFCVFNAFDFRKGRRLSFKELYELTTDMGVPMVEVLETGTDFDYTINELLEMAKGKYKGTKNNREGIVVRPMNPRFSHAASGDLSFKVINNDFLLKDED